MRLFETLRKMRIFSIMIITIVAVFSGYIIWDFISFKESAVPEDEESPPLSYIEKLKKDFSFFEAPRVERWRFVPGPVDMERMKNNGCVADGFLSGYGDSDSEMAKIINRSECSYLHRALETWLAPPDFDEAAKIMQKVEKKPMVFGMFIAEAISTKRSFESLEGKRYRFEKMCRKDTDGRWGKDTCIPSVQNVEYRRYLSAMTREAMDLGIQSFLFGQIELQDENPSFPDSDMTKVVNAMRKYAKEKGMEIIIGAQTNDVIDENYLRMFDYVEGGVGIDSNGDVEDAPCSSRYSGCWALLWHKNFSSKANNVFLHLDWNGSFNDDMGIFARMSQETRIKTLDKLYRKFKSMDMGFMMPFLAVLHPENGGCYGPNEDFYSPGNRFKCKDEDMINKIMRKL